MVLGPTSTGSGTAPIDLPDALNQSGNPTEVSSLLQSSADQASEDQSGGGQSASGGKGGKGSNSKVDPSLRLINTTPVSLDQSVDEPVTSGGDVVIGDTPGGGN